MVTRSNECAYRDECLRDGKGTVNIKDLANKEGLYGHGRLFAHITVEPGRSIGFHAHEHETEFFYIIKGEGLFNDNGKPVTVKAGDVCATGYGESHSMENVSDAPMEMIALIVME
ncbi:MAG: cupin domain-containing protein [Oscillibacter sp.]|nr:cupin domain-containing protein [Oscillibacter sp.]